MKVKVRPVKERQVHASAHGSRIHDKGAKADRDRAVVLHSYLVMCDEFRVPRRMRLTAREIAGMSNTQLYQASKDLYNNASVKQAQRLAVRLGVAQPPESWPRLRKVMGRVCRFVRLTKIRLGLVPMVKPPAQSGYTAPAPQPPTRSDLVLVKPEAVDA